jgi:signal transduction histidine kinase
MQGRTFNAPALRPQALLISFTLLLLVTLLGTKAYSVARTHFDELSSLANHDLKAQGLLLQMESAVSARDQARRKFRITRDREYLNLSSKHAEQFEVLHEELRKVLDGAPELKFEPNSDGILNLRAQLNERRESKINHAHEAALGLLRMIVFALVISILVTAWLFTLFYRGLLDPLARLKDATSRIRSGELSFRIKEGDGVTELRDLANSFNLMAARLEHLDSAKSEFLATISHEIKNPLAALKEGMNLLSSQGDSMLPLARSKAYSACLIAAKRLESMINNLLHHSRMEMGLFNFDLTPKSLTAVIRTAVDEVRPLADRKGMSIEYKGDEEIQAAFNWDGMVQVFENLLLNAIKYGNENSVIEVRAAIQSRAIENAELPHLELAVINDGKAISATDLAQVFERFYRGSNSKLQQGMGLGLHVVKRIVEAHHGGISAASEAGKTRFELWLPGRYETEAG